ncbi:hypothetical protein AN398_08770 [Corynebacterium pseudotuberculosis]|uniref:hypothetical protein n=1 Tax=Corynebacterium pseudotuberculosis TaxID=1719 RepID=UPI000737D386|nr:hypothetical protein [Corynebacterium pseudotuberculosis]ALU22145.1 hypothetical protein AN398_08770 [Corynebacterium pseudotuberculosis]ANH24497.1 Hypothetical protein CpE55_1831 [Corynebacterium pseudotuberculosis]
MTNLNPGQSASPYDDHRRPLLRALKYGCGALTLITLVSLVAWGWARDLPGIWGVLLGAAIGGGFVLLTALSVLVTLNTSAATTGAIVLGGWLLKIVVLIIVLVSIRGVDFYDKYAFLVTLVLALVVVLACEVWGVITSKVTYVS